MGSDFWDADKILRYDVSARPYRGGPDEAWRGRLGRRRPVGVHAAHGRRRGPEVRGSGRGCRARGLRVAVILRESCHLSIMPGVQQHPRQHICVMMSHMQQCTPVKQCAHRYHQQSCALHHCCSRSIPDSLPQHLRCSTAQRSGSEGDNALYQQVDANTDDPPVHLAVEEVLGSTACAAELPGDPETAGAAEEPAQATQP